MATLSSVESVLSKIKAEKSGEKLQVYIWDIWKCICLKVLLWFILGRCEKCKAGEQITSTDGRAVTSFLLLSPCHYTALLSKCKLT